MVTRRRGGFFVCAARWLLDVSPVRAPIRHSEEPSSAAKPAESLAQRSLRVGGERAHGRDPEHADCVIRIRAFARGKPGAERNRQRLARSRRRVEEPGPALRHETPGLPLKRKDCPVSTSKPGFDRKRAIDRMRSRRRYRRAGRTARCDRPVVLLFKSQMAFQGEPQLETRMAKKAALTARWAPRSRQGSERRGGLKDRRLDFRTRLPISRPVRQRPPPS